LGSIAKCAIMDTLQKSPTYHCSQCGSDLIFVSEVTEQLAGSQFPQTTAIYRCSNAECQKEKDIQTAKRIKLQNEKDKASAQKVEAKRKEKEDLQRISLEEKS
jgi:hypothetical protein